MTGTLLRRWWPALLLLLLPLPWLLPSDTTLRLGTAGAQPGATLTLDPPVPQPGQRLTARVRDTVPWGHVQLTINGQAAEWGGYETQPDGSWVWTWYLTAATPLDNIAFYHDCDAGCLLRSQWDVGPQRAPPVIPQPTKLGVVFPDPARDWHGRAGWGVELTYAMRPNDPFWGIDAVAARTHAALAQGMRVLVRVDYDQGQTLPPENDPVALESYLHYLSRLARDDRLAGVYGYIIGSGYNTLGANQQTGQPASARWVARLFNGYSTPPDQADNVVQRVRPLNPQVQLLVGPVRPWSFDSAGLTPDSVAPWLAYMEALVAALDEGTRLRLAQGVTQAGPDGFALHVPGNPPAAALAGHLTAVEPMLSLPRPAWGGAEAGFGVYREWLAIINRYPTTQNLPAYITSTNTLGPDSEAAPADTYPAGWLTTAVAVVNREPQIRALCWFIDRDLSGDARWIAFSLHEGQGRLADAAAEFDALLQADEDTP